MSNLHRAGVAQRRGSAESLLHLNLPNNQFGDLIRCLDEVSLKVSLKAYLQVYLRIYLRAYLRVYLRVALKVCLSA